LPFFVRGTALQGRESGNEPFTVHLPYFAFVVQGVDVHVVMIDPEPRDRHEKTHLVGLAADREDIHVERLRALVHARKHVPGA
jgi:hypothetical protein